MERRRQAHTGPDYRSTERRRDHRRRQQDAQEVGQPELPFPTPKELRI